MICDEVQCGMGRTGSFFAWQQYGVRPDILTMAKAIGNGFPVGAFALTEKVAECSLNPGDHGTTYGGGHLPVPQSQRLWRSMSASNLPEHTAKIGAYLRKQLENLAGRHTCIVSCKGKGLMQGIQLSIPPCRCDKKGAGSGTSADRCGKRCDPFCTTSDYHGKRSG